MKLTRRTLVATASLACAAALPVRAQPRLPRVGWLIINSDGVFAQLTEAGFIQGLAEAGYVDGKNVVLDRRSAQGQIKRLPALALELAAAGADVFFAPGKAQADAAWYANRKTPIVIATLINPERLGYVKSIGRPGTRVTGVLTSIGELAAKRVQLFAETVPGLRRLGVIIHEATLQSCHQDYLQMEEAATTLGLTLVPANIDGAADLSAAFKTWRSAGVQGIANTLVTSRVYLDSLGAQALQNRLPTMVEYEYLVRMGALLSYGPDYRDHFRRAGHFVTRILKGENPAEMPLEAAREFRLVINLDTANKLGILVPQSIVLRADETIG